MKEMKLRKSHNRKTVLFLLAILVLMSGCAAKSPTPNLPDPYQIRPGAVDELDSRAYDLLLLTEETLNAARETVDEIPITHRATFIATVNHIGSTYNLVRDAWKTYRGAILSARILRSSDPNIGNLKAELAETMNSLESALRQLFSGGN